MRHHRVPLSRLAKHLQAGTALLSLYVLATPALAAGGTPGDAAAATAASADKSDARKTQEQQRTQAEITVTARTHSPQGVSGFEPGGGLIQPIDAGSMQSTITRDFIAKQNPAANFFQLMSMSPGANVAGTDPYGMTGTNISVRGLNNDELGFTLESVPLNNVGNYIVYPQQYIDADTVKKITLSQGTVDVSAPVIGAVGGLVTVDLIDPPYQMGGLGNFSVGSFNMNREYIRFDTGLIGNSGIRAFISYSHFHSSDSRGPGANDRHHIDFKMAKSWSNGSTASLFVGYNDDETILVTLPNMAQWNQYGTKFIYDSTYTPNNTNYWKLHFSPVKNIEVSAPVHAVITSNLSFDVTPYLYYSYGGSTGATTLPASGAAFFGTQPVTLNLSGYTPVNGRVIVSTDIYSAPVRPGVVAKFNYDTGHNKFTAGYWFDWSRYPQTTNYTGVNADGSPQSLIGSEAQIRMTDGNVFYTQNQTTDTTIHAIFASDTLSLMDDRLKLTVSGKQTWVTRDATNTLPGSPTSISLHDSRFTPHFNAHFDIDGQNSVYFAVNTAFRTPISTSLFNTYNGSTGAVVITGNAHEKDETSVSEEIGYRYNGGLLVGSIAAFNYDFKNRQISSTTQTVNGLTTQYINQGGETIRGVDVELGLRPFHHLRPYISGEYLDAKINDNFVIGTDALPTKGKTAVRAPHWQGALALDYDDNHFIANLGIKYYSKQYSTFMDDESIGGHANVDAMIGYRFPSWGLKKRPELRLNVYNLFNSKYLSGPASVTTNAKATVGVNGTTIAAAGSPAYYVGALRTFVATLSLGF